MRTKVSILCATFRPGGLDVLFAGLRAQTFGSFEVVIVDHRYALRHDRVLAKAGDLSLIHVPEHRRNGKWGAIGAAWNTAMALADGEWLLLIPDYTYIPPGWIEAHLARLTSESLYTVAPYRYFALPEVGLRRPHDFSDNAQVTCRLEDDAVLRGEVLEEWSAFTVPFDATTRKGLKPSPFPHQDVREWKAGGEAPTAWVHLKNEGIHRDLAFRVNGVDERLDRGKGPLDVDWGTRLFAAGARLTWTPEALSECLNPRPLCVSMPFGHRDRRVENRWSYQDGGAYNERRRVESLRGDIQAKNPWTLRELREKLLGAGWRDADKEIDVSKLEQDDRAYWGREIWPDTKD